VHLFEKTNEEFKADLILIKIVYSEMWTRSMLKFIQLLNQKLIELNKKSLTFVKVKELEFLLSLSQLILVLSNEKILSSADSLMVRTDLDESTKELVETLKGNEESEVVVNLVERMSYEEKFESQKLIRLTLVSFINLRVQGIGRS
jgi:hypothetical protein